VSQSISVVNKRCQLIVKLFGHHEALPHARNECPERLLPIGCGQRLDFFDGLGL
jgi:hypothetical protein